MQIVKDNGDSPQCQKVGNNISHVFQKSFVIIRVSIASSFGHNYNVHQTHHNRVGNVRCYNRECVLNTSTSCSVSTFKSFGNSVGCKEKCTDAKCVENQNPACCNEAENIKKQFHKKYHTNMRGNIT